MKNWLRRALEAALIIMFGLLLSTVALCVAVIVLAGCSTTEVRQPEPEEPDATPAPKVPEPEETPDEVFNREVDACFEKWDECKETRTDKECWPPHESCVVEAYRKLKKARRERAS